MSGLESQAGISLATSVASMGLFACWKIWKKRKVYGCLLPKGKTYAQTTLCNERKLLFIDLDGAISEGVPLHKIDSSKLRLEVYPKATTILQKIIEEHPTKKIVLCSSDFELLCHIGLRKRTFAFIPSKDMIEKDETDEKQVIERMAYQFKTELEKKKQIEYNNYEQLTMKLYKIFK